RRNAVAVLVPGHAQPRARGGAEARRPAGGVERTREAGHRIAARGHRAVEPGTLDRIGRQRRGLAVGAPPRPPTLAVPQPPLPARLGLLDRADVVRASGALEMRATWAGGLAERGRAPALHRVAFALDRAAGVAAQEDALGAQAIGRREPAVGIRQRARAADLA